MRYSTPAIGYINIKKDRHTFHLTRIKRVWVSYCFVVLSGCTIITDTSSELDDYSGSNEFPLTDEDINLTSKALLTSDNGSSDANSLQFKTPLQSPLDMDDQGAPEPSQGLWKLLRASLQLDHRTDEKRVRQEIRWLQKHPEYWQRLAPRMQRYLPFILDQIEARGLPAELALLPIVESALDPYAFSPYGASGLWQFMRPTAEQYGLRINDHYDGRRDIVSSTTAALDFLQDLYRRFEDWPLALAAYNAGGGTVSKAIRRGKTRDFFSLQLPNETKTYVPRLLAISAIAADPQAYGIELPIIEDKDPFRVIDLPSPFDVAVVAQVLKLEISDIYSFNPALKRSQWTEKTPLRLVIPESYPREISNTEAAELLDAVSVNNRQALRNIVVKSGDTLSEIAAAHNTSSQHLMNLNRLNSSVLQIGQQLRVPGASQLSRSRPARTQTYVVRPGDSLWRIARQGGFTIGTLVKLNEIGRSEVLGIGQELQIPATDALVFESGKAPSQVRKINYRVRSGDSLSRIAQRFGIRVSDIVGWNNIRLQKYLQPGQGLTLYIDVVGG